MGKKNKNKNKNGSGSLSPYNQQRERGGLEGASAAVTHSSDSTITMMECEICKEEYDANIRKPRNLLCGHSFCSSCCKLLINHRSISCPKCRKETPANDVETLAVNFPVLNMIASPAVNNAAPSPSKYSSPKDMSPHGGKCLEAQVEIAMHCAHCNLWLCKDCSRIDHRHPECLLMPYQDTLREMKQANAAKVKSIENSLEEFSRESKLYDTKLKSCASLIEMALDCIKKEQTHLAGLRDHSQKMERDLRDLRSENFSPVLEEALSFLKGMEMANSVMQNWTTNAFAILKGDQVFSLSKILLQTAVQMHMQQNNGRLVAVHNIKDVTVTFPLEKDGGRLLVHTGSAQNGPPQPGCRMLKLEHVKACIDPSRALTFLEISLRGQVLGRVFIRLLGCTKQSRCFLMMCMGEMGASFLNTRFHRLWWSDQAGEHVWVGDYDHGNGSGGTLHPDILHEIKELPEKKTQVPITQGLVAGRYGKCNSSIFRVYTRSSDTLEEAAFGRVEYGLNFLKDALQCKKSITEIIISACGVVIES
ncbi:uncharacterized protein LOC123505538 [Portunus trituberculatus]|uniref:uncharacterized protein LOC123505538 n=1 Tax=Portunus trituberculatus TaxID=210409 RepID=UPI001E1CCDCA|nr:uncharacterized protein LOC123505538 [Portunus trituberculatus]XP_045112911.1 uncharacterized protein LOC123505538 [Portunus trituberculatus]